MGVLHEAGSAYSIKSNWLCYQLVRFFMVTYNGKHCIMNLSY